MAWSNLRNGDLLRLADRHGFEVFLTTDQNMKYQQNLAERRLAVAVLPTTSWPVIQQYTFKVTAAFNSIQPGDFIEIDFWQSILLLPIDIL